MQSHSEALQRANAEVSDLKKKVTTLLHLEVEIADIQKRLSKLEQLWIYFQEFINEQSVDKLKLLRSHKDNTIVAKMESVEWMARYIRYIPKTNIILAAKDFKAEFMTDQQTQRR